jgi:hypothetical protein
MMDDSQFDEHGGKIKTSIPAGIKQIGVGYDTAVRYQNDINQYGYIIALTGAV